MNETHLPLVFDETVNIIAQSRPGDTSLPRVERRSNITATAALAARVRVAGRVNKGCISCQPLNLLALELFTLLPQGFLCLFLRVIGWEDHALLRRAWHQLTFSYLKRPSWSLIHSTKYSLQNKFSFLTKKTRRNYRLLTMFSLTILLELKKTHNHSSKKGSLNFVFKKTFFSFTFRHAEMTWTVWSGRNNRRWTTMGLTMVRCPCHCCGRQNRRRRRGEEVAWPLRQSGPI